MELPFTILIADKNRHVRDFLRRELGAEGYKVRIAKDGRKLLMMIHLEDPPDLVIVDPEIPYSGELAILQQLQAKAPPLPFIIHTFLPEYANDPSLGERGTFVEKRGNIDHLKAAVMKVLARCYPDRAACLRPNRGDDQILPKEC